MVLDSHEFLQLIEFAEIIGSEYKATSHQKENIRIYFLWLDDFTIDQKKQIYKFADTLSTTKYSGEWSKKLR